MTDDQPREFSPRRALLGLAGFAGAGAILSAANAICGVGVPCPWRALTGTLCPLCGSTSLGVALLHFDPAAAFTANPFVFGILVVLGFLGIAWVVEAIGGPALRPPRPLRGISQDRWYLVLGILAAAFAVIRNVS